MSIPNPNNLPRVGHRSTSYLSSFLLSALCNIWLHSAFLVVPSIFLLFMFTLCSLQLTNNVSFTFDKKKITAENLPRYYPSPEVSQVLAKVFYHYFKSFGFYPKFISVFHDF